MNTRTLQAFALLLCAGAPLTAVANGPSANTGYRDREVLVKFRDRAPALPLAGAMESVPQGGHWQRVRLAPGQRVADVLSAYSADPQVAAVQPNYVYRTQARPDDPDFPEQWALENVGQRVSGATLPPLLGVSGGDMGLPQAWDRITDCSSVVVAVLDTGVNYTHRDLVGNLWDGSNAGLAHHGWDVVGGDDDPMPEGGGELHGTHVAGIIGARGNNGVGTSGVCWRANLMLVRVLDQSGAGSTTSLVEGVHFAVDHGARIINMSLGRRGPRDPMLEEAIADAGSKGVLVVTSAANGGSDGVGDDNDALLDAGASNAVSVYPCAFDAPNLLCVTALDQTYSLAGYANYGATSVDLAAPGSNIFAPRPGPRIDDPLQDWQIVGDWSPGHCAVNSLGSFAVLAAPGDWCLGGTYAAGTQRIYKTFTLPGLRAVQLRYRAAIDVADTDRFSTRVDAQGGDPFDGQQDHLVQQQSGRVQSAFAYPLNDCGEGGCSIGFELASDAGGSGRGVAVFDLHLDTLQVGSDSYQTLSGTSMAAPHVTGIAAMLWALNPAYEVADVAAALRQSGDALPSLAGVTVTGRAADAAGAVRYIETPQGVRVSVGR